VEFISYHREGGGREGAHLTIGIRDPKACPPKRPGALAGRRTPGPPSPWMALRGQPLRTGKKDEGAQHGSLPENLSGPKKIMGADLGGRKLMDKINHTSK